MPSIGHGWVQRLLAFALTLYLRANPGGYAGSEVHCIFGPRGRRRAYVPDYIFISAERRGSWKLDGPFRAAPDLAVEILSPGDRMSRVLRKIRFFLENGVRQVWLIDPMRRTIEVYTEPAISHVYSDEQVLDGGDVLPGFSTPVHELLPDSEARSGSTATTAPAPAGP